MTSVESVLPIMIAFVIITELARRFGRGTGFAIGVGLLPFIFFPILGLDDSEYEGYVEPAI